MMRARLAVVGSCLAVLAAAPLSAQAFTAGTNYIGPAVSLSTYGSSAEFLGNFEHAINDKWGWGISVGYFSYGDAVFSYKVIPIAGTAAYHFAVSNEKLDPFVGGTVGFFIWNCSVDGASCGAGGVSHGLLIGGFGGVRYWTSEKLALSARAGFGVGILSVGVDFKM
jgi:hypothetical protein